MTVLLQGIGAAKGVAIAPVRTIERGQPKIREYELTPKQVRSELARFRRALKAARAELKHVKNKIPNDTATDVEAFIDTHLLMLEDSALTSVPMEIIKERRCNAEWALRLQRDAVVSVFDAMDDEYLRTRKDDVDHVVNRMLRILLQRDQNEDDQLISHLSGCIVVADDLTPADTVLMQHHGVAAVVTEFGGPLSHTAILARSLRIPAIVGLHAARQYLRDDEVVIVDGRQGVMLVDPSRAILGSFKRKQKEIERFRVERQKLRRARVMTSDGERIGLQANVELPGDIQTSTRAGADGVGLYRTEFLFMNRREPPDEEEQFETYRYLVRALKGAPVTIRTLDLGADKQVDGVRPGAPASTNPALGMRAIRLCLKEPELFTPQIRAIMRASAYGPVRMMIPMLSNIQELHQVLALVKQCGNQLLTAGVDFDEFMPIGAMIEVPAAALAVITSASNAVPNAGLIRGLFMSVGQVLLFALLISLVLRFRSLSERTTQTLTALFGATTLLQFLALPFFGWHEHLLPEGPDPVMILTTPLLVAAGIASWSLAVMSSILRQAMECGLGLALLIIVACQSVIMATIMALSGSPSG